MAPRVDTRTVRVPGASLYVEVRGAAPVLLCISGGPTDAGMFGDLGARLDDRYTVISYDQRGPSRSPLGGEPGDIPIAQHAPFGVMVEAGDPRTAHSHRPSPRPRPGRQRGR